MPELSIGDPVKVILNHWLRGGEVGKIVFIDPKRRTHPFLVEFPSSYDGGGIDGNSLYLSINQFERIEVVPSLTFVTPAVLIPTL